MEGRKGVWLRWVLVFMCVAGIKGMNGEFVIVAIRFRGQFAA